MLETLDFTIRIGSTLLFLSDEGPMLETLDYTIRIGSTLTFLYFDLYLCSAYAAQYVYRQSQLFKPEERWADRPS